ncbi:hypothetical protein NDA18_001661 [Ustilago nuda]|nr:hypothetical protein NDA18_001661 [Ustilago nuda]
MSCPFAKFASLFPCATKEDSSYHHRSSSSSSSSSPSSSLSEALRLGTASSHRAVEKSLGVSLLLQSINPSTSSTSPLKFDKVDYIRFNIMLACIYIALEASLHNSREQVLVKALFNDAGLMQALARTQGLLRDVGVHLGTVELHTGATLADLAEASREENAAISLSSVVAEDVESEGARGRLLQLVQSSLPIALLLNPTETRNTGLTEEHIALLTPAQMHATLSYVSTLLNLSQTGNRGPLLSHAYTRYLGDLSGGQHIVRKLCKRFATDKGDGFEFYSFSAGADLKSRFRVAMQSTLPNPATTSALVAEANRAFDLNTALFESLLPADLRMQPERVQVEPNQKLGAVQVALKGKDTGHRWMMVALACVAMALWIGYSFMLVKQGFVQGAVA